MAGTVNNHYRGDTINVIIIKNILKTNSRIYWHSFQVWWHYNLDFLVVYELSVTNCWHFTVKVLEYSCTLHRTQSEKKGARREPGGLSPPFYQFFSPRATLWLVYWGFRFNFNSLDNVILSLDFVYYTSSKEWDSASLSGLERLGFKNSWKIKNTEEEINLKTASTPTSYCNCLGLGGTLCWCHKKWQQPKLPGSSSLAATFTSARKCRPALHNQVDCSQWGGGGGHEVGPQILNLLPMN